MSRPDWERVLLITLGGSLLGSFLLLFSVTRFAIFSVVDRQLTLHGFPDAATRSACAGRPVVEDGWKLWAYTHSFEPLRPEAPALPPWTRAEAAWFDRAARFDAATRQPQLLRRVSADGTCAWALYQWAPDPETSDRFLTTYVASLTIVAAAFGAALARGFAIPLARSRAEAAANLAANAAITRHLDEVSHDLRTPLASLQLRLDALRAAPDPETWSAAAGDLAYLTQLVGNLHLAARLDRPQPSVPVDLGAVASRVGARFAALGRRQGVDVITAVPDRPVWVRGDPDALEQALSNLVHNAVAHHGTAGGGHVAVTLDVDAGAFTLRVLDDGPGVPAEALSALQEAVDAAPDHRPRGRCVGLGLAIVGAICRRHGYTASLTPGTPSGLLARITGALAPPSPGG